MNLGLKDPHLCYVCLSRSSAVTHEIIPRSKGGAVERWNQVELCSSCDEKIHREGTSKWQERLKLAKQYYEEVFIPD
jgi:5-methylcytosine-specific restriction endonuclease McrA